MYPSILITKNSHMSRLKHNLLKNINTKHINKYILFKIKRTTILSLMLFYGFFILFYGIPIYRFYYIILYFFVFALM